MTETFAGFERHEIAGIPVLWQRDERFKTFRFAFHAQCPLDETAAARALLPSLLMQGTTRNPDRPSLARRMEQLYGASVAPGAAVVGAAHVLKFSLDMVAGRYLPERPDQLGDGLRFLSDFLARPRLESGRFNTQVFEREQTQLADAVRAIADNKTSHAAQRALQLACAGETIGIPDHGGLDAILALDAVEPEQARVDFLARGQCWAVAMGALPEGEFLDSVGGFLEQLPERSEGSLPAIDPVQPRQARRDIERCELQQSKLVLTFRIPDSKAAELWVGRRLFASLLGGGPHSRLFREVREKHSLAYYAQAQADLHKGLLMVQTGLDEAAAGKAEAEILRHVAQLQAGDFSEEELEVAKAGVMSSLTSIDDSIAQRCAFTSDRWLIGSDRTPAQQAEEYARATREEVIAAAEGIWLDHVFLLAGKESSAAPSEEQGLVEGDR